MITKPWYVKKPISSVKKTGFPSSVRHVGLARSCKEKSDQIVFGPVSSGEEQAAGS
jgi:hypothetical protein